MSGVEILEPNELWKQIYTIILSYGLAWAYGKAVDKRINNSPCILLLAAALISWIIVGDTFKFSMIDVFITIILGWIIPEIIKMVERKEFALALASTSYSFGMIIWGLMHNKYYLLGVVLVIIGMAIFTWSSRKKSIRSQ